MLHRELLIDGHFYGGPCDQSVAKAVIRNPWNGETVGTAAEASWVEARAAVEAAHRAFASWRHSKRQERADLLTSIADSIANRLDELSELLMLEVGKPITLAQGEVKRMELTFRLAAESALTFGKEQLDVSYDRRANGHRVSVNRFPLGVILAIAPYNWPYNLAAHKLAPAIATGNTVVLKGSSLSPLTTLTLGRLIHEAGCPAGIVNVINADGATAERMAELPQIAKISFTGSPKVGWHLKRKLADHPVTLELGGNAFAIVGPDVPVEDVAASLIGSAFAYAGQICISTQHILLPEDGFEHSLSVLVEAARACPFGDPALPETVCGPLIHEDAAKKVESWIQEAIAAGATLHCGGSRKGNRLEPAVLSNVPPQVKLSCEEVFGPVVTVEPYAAFDDALARINSSEYGIHAALFTHREDLVQLAYRELEVGGLIVNDPPTLRFDKMPYGGVKRSGFGREGIEYAMAEMTTPKTLVWRP
jgi:acyl-CoA reductase-like NAD-dependent aldehyde dehydrogenase